MILISKCRACGHEATYDPGDDPVHVAIGKAILVAIGKRHLAVKGCKGPITKPRSLPVSDSVRRRP